MKAVDKVFDFIVTLDKKEFLKYTYITVGAIIVIASFITYRHFSKLDSLKKELSQVNTSREEAKVILTKEVEVKRQKAIVDEIFEKDTKFKILDYFNSVTTQLGLDRNIRNRDLTANDLETLSTQGYQEVKLTIKFTDLNMKQLTDILDEFEKNERIYTKSLEITKSSKTPTIDVDLVIATLQPKTELSEATE